MDALGIATVDSITYAATAGLPFAPSRSFSSMTDEDVINLRTLQRLVLLLSGIQENESSITVRAFACLVSHGHHGLRTLLFEEKKMNLHPRFSWKFYITKGGIRAKV